MHQFLNVLKSNGGSSILYVSCAILPQNIYKTNSFNALEKSSETCSHFPTVSINIIAWNQNQSSISMNATKIYKGTKIHITIFIECNKMYRKVFFSKFSLESRLFVV